MKIAKNNNRKPSKRLIGLSIVIGLMAWAIIPRAITVYDLRQQMGELEKQKAQLLAHNQALLQEKESLNSPEALEKIARERLGMLKEGERYLIKKEDKNQP